MQTLVDLQVAIVLHRLATGENVRCLVLRFGFSKAPYALSRIVLSKLSLEEIRQGLFS